LIQVYTGNGKGKTTAALGLALRASGAGLKIWICQFIKGRDYCELKALRKIKNIKLAQFGRNCFIKDKPSAQDIILAQKGLAQVKSALKKRLYDLIILDEINIALKLKLLDLKDVVAMIKGAPKNLEIVLTGRHAPKEIIEIADLTSEIKEIKHYFQRGLKARKGIEF
jgi:cob(I)alamin adenosyltransferase